jgi:hypothetical protein
MADKSKMKQQPDAPPAPSTFERFRSEHSPEPPPSRGHRRRGSGGERKRREFEDDDEFDDDEGGASDGSYFSDEGSIMSDRGEDGGDMFDDEEMPHRDDGQKSPGVGAGAAPPRMTYEEQVQKKAELLEKLLRRKQRNLLKLEVDENMTLEQLMVADARTKYRTSSESSVNLMRRGILMYMVMLETMAKRFPQLNVDLEGFSQDAYGRGTAEYDDLLYEIYDMYSDKVKMNPVLQLFGHITSQALMYSMARRVMGSVLNRGAPRMPPQPVPQPQPQMAQPRPQVPAFVQQPTSPRSSPSPQPPPPAAQVSDEIGVMDGPDDFDQGQLLNALRQEQQQKLNQRAADGQTVQQQQQQTGEFKTIEALPSAGGARRPGVQIVRERKKRAPRAEAKTITIGGGNQGDDTQSQAHHVMGDDLGME